MEDKNIPLNDTKDDLSAGLLNIAIDEYGLSSVVGVCLLTLMGASIGGLIGIKIYIKDK